MATYLLLRNNKQQGPLSLQHLIQLGLKPYDLVWVEGKSAAWRYPSEIPELKPYSAAVEEQPFDRFYKKPEEKPEERETPVIQFPDEIKEEKNIKEEPKRMQPVENKLPDIVFPDDEQYEQYKPQVEQKEEKTYPTKTVYVTMPVRDMHEPKQEPRQEPVYRNEPVYKREEPVFNLQSSPIDDTYEEPVSLNTKYSQPLDEIKEMYVQKLNDRKKQSAKKKYVVAGIKKAAVVIGIISIGVLIGFAIKPKGNTDKLAAVNPNSSNTVQQKTEDVPNESASEQTKEAIQAQMKHKVSDEIASGQKETPKKKITQQQPLVENNTYEPVESKPVITENKKAVMQKQKQTEEQKEDDAVTYKPAPAIETNSAGERTKKTRNESDNNGYSNSNDEEKNDDSRSSSKEGINEMVSVKSNDYYVVAFGGIRNLQLTVENDSKYILDKVTVKVDYVRPNGFTLKSDNINFKSVSPNGSSTIRVPDTNRGVKVYYKIVKIESKEYKNDVAGL